MLDPDIFIDTHTTNGADYPYTMTLIATQQDKLARPLGRFMAEQFTPALYEGMAGRQPMVPYVNVFGRDARQKLCGLPRNPPLRKRLYPASPLYGVHNRGAHAQDL